MNRSIWSVVFCFVMTAGCASTGMYVAEQSQRTTLVSRLQIAPGEVMITLGQPVIFTAVAYDTEDAPMSGVNVTWGAYDLEREQEVQILPSGEFAPRSLGSFRVTAKAGEQEAQVIVKVAEASSRDESLQATVEDGWDETNLDSALDPINRRGRNPVYSSQSMQLSTGPSPDDIEDQGAGSSNFMLTVPLLHLDGRGLDLTLALTYNSRLWHKAEHPVLGERITFDIDADRPAPSWPAPGWSLGFTKVVAADWEPMLVDPDGTRHRVGTTTLTFDDSGRTLIAQSYDGTFIHYSDRMTLDKRFVRAQAKYPDGTVVDFTTPGPYDRSLYASRITDANGNYITITYRNNRGPATRHGEPKAKSRSPSE